MMDNNLETRVALLEKDVTYLKDGHAEMKSTIKELSSLPRLIDKIDTKLDTVITQQQEMKKDVKEELKDIEERIDCLEEEESAVVPNKILGFEYDKAVKLAYAIVAVCIAIVIIYGIFTGHTIPVIGGR